MSQLRQHQQELDRRDVQVVVVTFQAGPLAEAYARQTEVRWPILIDQSLTLYRAYGMERGKWGNIFGAASIASYTKLLLRGRKLQLPQGDPYQLGGDVLIDPQGIVRLHHVGTGPADRPPVRTLLDAVV